MLIVLEHSHRSNLSMVNAKYLNMKVVLWPDNSHFIAVAAGLDVRISCTVQDCCRAERHGTKCCQSYQIAQRLCCHAALCVLCMAVCSVIWLLLTGRLFLASGLVRRSGIQIHIQCQGHYVTKLSRVLILAVFRLIRQD